MTEYDTYCPDFKIGKCNKDLNCKYFKHIVCKENYTCRDLDCELGHGISIIKRLIICNICDDYYNEDFYNSNKEHCKYSCNCFIKGCNKIHIINYNNRLIINEIINIEDDDKATNLYNKYFKNDIENKNIKTNNIQTNSIENNIKNELKDNNIYMLNFKKALTQDIIVKENIIKKKT